MNLKLVQEELQNAKITTTFLKADDNVPVERVMALFEMEDKSPDESQLLEIMLLPDVSEELNGLEVIQYFVSSHFESSKISQNKIEELNQLIIQFNFELVIGSFGWDINENYIYFKYRQVISTNKEGKLNGKVVIITNLIHHQINKYMRLLEDIVK
tara:strand:- start:376 stop:843 length:468 start_codon:yes stop_codon:yes gene_type:complete